MLHVFHGLTIRCTGALTGVTFYARHAGVFWLDLWKQTPGETETLTLAFSQSITATRKGPHIVRFPLPSKVEKGLTIGIHASVTEARPLRATEGKGYRIWRVNWSEEMVQFQIGKTEITSEDNEDTVPTYRIPSLQLHICPTSMLIVAPGMLVICSIFIKIYVYIYITCIFMLSAV